MQREENPDSDERMKKHGKTIGTWVCDKETCKHQMDSFLYNFETHIPVICPKCNEGNMAEDESKRETQTPPQFKDAHRERNWLKNASQAEQVRVFSDDNEKPY